MSSDESKNKMPVRIDEDVLEWIAVLKTAQGKKNMSDVVRDALLRLYPDIESIVETDRQMRQKREDLLSSLIDEEDDAE